MPLHHHTPEEIYDWFLRYPGVTTDSRNISQGDLFFALKGDRFDGNQYAQSAISMGASRAIVDDPSLASNDQMLFVSDVLTTLQQVAKIHRRSVNPLAVIGITGSNGKTTTKELVTAVLQSQYRTVATRGNLNNHIGVPLTLLRTTHNTEMLIIEMGANHSGEIASLCELAQPTAGIITCIGKAHLEGFGSLSGVISAKKELFEAISNTGRGPLFCNADDPLIMKLANDFPIRKVPYGSASDAQVKGSILGKSLMLNVQWENRVVKTHLVGDFNFPNTMAAIAVGKEYGVNEDEVALAISRYQPENHRSQFQNSQYNQLLLDCYNANPSSMSASVTHFLSFTSSRERLMILGDMFELGADELEEHQKIADLLVESANEIILVGKAFLQIKASANIPRFADVDQLADHLKAHPVRGKFVLLKGSRGMHLDQLIPLL